MTGIVSALGGILWGNLLGVDVNLALVGFKVFPVVILGGLDSIPGAILGGLIVGVVEVMSVAYLASSYRDAFAFAVMILILLVRPTGLLGARLPTG
jgi:branched-chain amino acid transport system permease protein